MEVDLSIVISYEKDSKDYLQQLLDDCFKFYPNAEYILCIRNESSSTRNYINSLSSSRNIKTITLTTPEYRLEYTYKEALGFCTKKIALFLPHQFFHFDNDIFLECRDTLSRRFFATLCGINFRVDESFIFLASREVFSYVSFPLTPRFKEVMFDALKVCGIDVFSYEVKLHDFLSTQPVHQVISKMSQMENRPESLYKQSNAKKYQKQVKEAVYRIPEVNPPNYKVLDSINIFILSHERPSVTERCIESIQKYIIIPKKIFICDNNSSQETKSKLEEIKNKYDNIKIYFNQTNKWVCGLNQAINENITDVFVISDNDIFLHDYQDKDVINHMYKVLQKYKLGSIGLNFYKANKVVRENPQPDRDVILTAFLDSTFQLMRKDLFKTFERIRKVEFTKYHMSNRKYKVGFTCDPYFCDHLDAGIEYNLLRSGDKEYVNYAKKKLQYLENESPTRYPTIRDILRERSYI